METLNDYRRSTYAEIRNIIATKGVTEDEFRNNLYRDNPCPNPDTRIETFVQRVFHPSEEDLADELSNGL